MKAIIVAAGRGRRLGTETADIPKCMVLVGGRPILHWQLDALVAAGVDDVVIVRGYLGDRIAPPSGVRVRFVDNPQWAENNILTSLFYARDEMREPFLFSYSDIVFTHAHARAVAAADGSIALIVDRRWRDAYDGRLLHPVSEAELARVEGSGADAVITRVGKRLVAAEDAAGEFSGLARFGADGADALAAVWAEALARGLDAPFGAAATLAPGLPHRRPQRGVGARRDAAPGAGRRWLARDRHRGGSGARRTRARHLERLACRAATRRTGFIAWTRPNGWRRRAPSSITRRRRWRGGRRASASRTRGARPAWRGTRCWSSRHRRTTATAAATWSTSWRWRRPRTRGDIPDDVRAAARLLRDTPPRPPDLVTIGKPDMAPLEAARAIADYARGYVSENG